ncbi:interferon-inducible GTPase 5 [Paramisgurnus dabryanus]|uniref:interferon-inducible GTPase 5 n=1 Tax=Paramisgurnus dabryanus TaxID=90735 RepID=UPI0031F3959B
MSDEVNVFMDPFLNVYTNAGEIAVADRLTESFHKDIVLREQQRNKELFEPVRVIQSKLYKAMERAKPKLNISLQMRNEETLGMCKPKSYMLIEPVKEKDPECLKKDILEEQHDARLENVKSNEPNPTEAQQYNDTLKTMEDKENIETDQPNNTEEKKYINTKPEEHAYDNVYEDPDLLTNYSSAGYAHKTEQHLREKFKCLDNVTLHIAVTGSTGAGKSSFINAIRGLKYDDKNAAPTGVTETTMLPTMYEHPTMPNVKFWDLPGTGSPKFKAKKYLKDVKLETYDFFIIISSERFKENDIMLAKAIKERKKIFYFLRSKIDNDIAAESQRKDFDEQNLLSLIRQDCQRNLRDLGDPYVFLISSFDLHKYDFQALTDTLANQLLDHKRDALILSLPVYSSKILEEKINTFMKQTRSAAVASGSIAVAPVPGLSIACDAVILLAFFTKCYYAFGLDDDSVEKLSKRVNNPFLKSIRKSPLVVAIGQKKLSSDVLSTLTSKEAGIKFAWSMVPGVGSKKAAEMSYSATFGLLRAGLQELADTARQMLKAAGVADVY